MTISEKEWARKFLKVKKQDEDDYVFLDPRDLALELEESERQLDLALADKQAIVAEREGEIKQREKLEATNASLTAEISVLRASLPELKASLAEFKNVLKEERGALQQARASLSDERALRAAAEAKLAAIEARLAAELSKPAPKPEQIREFYPMPEPVADYKMTVNRDKNGRITEATLKPVRTG